MSEFIDVQNEHNFPINADALKHAAKTALTMQLSPAESEITIVLTNDESVKELNQQFRGIDAPTDVLSFPADLPPMPEGEEPDTLYLGDLVIAYPYTRVQAEREGHPLEDSFKLLVVHGVLHLLGFDHDTPQNRAIMWAQQANILTALGISTDLVPALEGDDVS
jgi:probable rRNA maturation factor